MNALCRVALCVSLPLSLFGGIDPAHAGPMSGTQAATSSAPVAEAEALGLAFVEAVEKSADCPSLGPNLDAVVTGQASAIQALSATKAPNSGALSADHQKRLLAAAKKVKGCSGQVKSPALDSLMAALAAYGERARPAKKPANLASESWCEDNCCLKGWETWAAVSFFTAACLAGDAQGCCLAATLASYDACVDLYCPDNDCCEDISPGGPPK